MAAMMSFHAQKCPHLVGTHATYVRQFLIYSTLVLCYLISIFFRDNPGYVNNVNNK